MSARWRRVFRNPFARRAEERAVAEEVSFHLAEIERGLVAAGWDPDEARAEAVRRFGDPARWRRAAVEAAAQRARAVQRRSVVEALVGEGRAAVRHLLRHPAGTAAALLIMTLGVASGTTVWAVLDPVLVRPLSMVEDGRVLAITGTNERSKNWWLSSYSYERIREGQQSFSAMAATREGTATLLEPFPDEVGALRVESSFFALVGIFPALGRAFSPDEDAATSGSLAILTHDLWRDRFNADPDILGRRVRLAAGPATVVGVMPAGFRWEVDEFDGPRPEGADRGILLNGVFHDDPATVDPFGRYLPLARLTPEATASSAQADLERIARGLVEAHPEVFADSYGWGRFSLRAWTVRERLLWLVEDQIRLLAGAVVLLLALVGLNAGSLLIVSLLDRREEMALRASLGASRRRLLGQVVVETGLLWALGLGLGLVLAALALPVVRHLAPTSLPFTGLIDLDLRVVAGAGALTVVLWLGSALPTAWLAPGLQRLPVLAGGGRTATRRTSRTQRLLITGQMALACALVGGAALLVRSYASLLRVPPGAENEEVLALEMRLPADLVRPTVTVGDLGGPWNPEYLEAGTQLYGPGDRLETLVDRVVREIEALPGVRSAAFTPVPPFWTSLSWRGVLPPDQSWETAREEMVWARIKWVTTDYFETVGIPLLRGRPLRPADRFGAERVVVVNEAFADRFVPGEEDPLGRAIPVDVVGGYVEPDRWRVVGLVPNVLHYGPHEPREATVYLPLAQLPRHWADDQVGWTRRGWFLVAYSGDPVAVMAGARSVVWNAVPDVPIRTETTLREMRDAMVTQPRFFTTLLGAFAGVAFALAITGLMAMLAQQVRHRFHEYGVRKALGAGLPDIVRRTLYQGVSIAGVGILIGTAGAWYLARTLASLVDGVHGWSPGLHLGVVALLLASALVASVGPALRAASVDPAESLRAE